MFDYLSHKGKKDQLSEKKPCKKTFDLALITGRPKNEYYILSLGQQNDSYTYRGYIFTKSSA